MAVQTILEPGPIAAPARQRAGARAAHGLLSAVRSNRKATAGFALFAVFCVMAAVPGLIAPYSPTAMIFPQNAPPSLHHLLGTTSYGQDIFSQLIWGARQSMIIALAVGLLSTVISVIVGVSSAYLGGFADDGLSVVTDVFLVIPTFPLIVVIAAYARNGGTPMLIAVLVITGWSYGARQLRAQTLSLRRRDFLESARVRGERSLYIIIVEVLPSMTSLIVASFLGAALYAVLAAASLQFVGLGDTSTVSWGTMLYFAENNEALAAGTPLWAIMPGLCVALLGAVVRALELRLRRDQQPGPAASQDEEAPWTTRRFLRSATSRSLTPPRPGRSWPSTPSRSRSGAGNSSPWWASPAAESRRCCSRSPSCSFRRRRSRPGASCSRAGDLVGLTDKVLRHLRWKEYSVVMQSAMNALNPVKSIASQFKDAMDAHSNLSRKAVRERSAEVLQMVGIDPVHLDSHPHQLSGGMRQRAMIAMALLFTPDLVIMDEPTSALDVVAQRSLMVQIKQLQQELGFAVIFVTHDMSLVSHFSDRLAVMYAGQVAELGRTSQVFDKPLHPYSKGLLEAFPSIRGPKLPLIGIPGSPPDLARPPTGCRFQPRCPEAMADCPLRQPELYEVEDSLVRCLQYDPLR